MKKTKILFLLILAVALFALGVFLYETTAVSMSDILPDDNWTKAQIFIYRSNEPQAVAFEGAQLKELLDALNGTAVNNGAKFAGMAPPYFHIHLAQSDGPGTLIYVLENGRIAIAVDYDTENYRYFEVGEVLYQTIAQLVSE